MRTAVGLLLIVHGVIHLVGFFAPRAPARFPQWTGRTSGGLSPRAVRVVDTIWAPVAGAFVIAGVLALMGHARWWWLAAPAIVASQAAIAVRWADAKAGTIGNAVLACAVAAAAGRAHFEAGSARAARTLFANVAPTAADVLRASDVEGLPPPVRRWLAASGAIGRPVARTVRLRQRGELRTAPDAEFMPAEAEQYFTVDPPGFVWTVDVAMKGVVPVLGRDTYVDGRGHMFITVSGVFPVADGTGPGFDQGTALRFLGEIIWFPSAAISKRLRWEAVDERRARATIAWGNVVAEGVFTFTDDGRFARLEAQRYLDGKSLTTWTIPATHWAKVRGVEMPTRGTALWSLPSGEFEYYRWEILDVETNVTSLYPH